MSLRRKALALTLLGLGLAGGGFAAAPPRGGPRPYSEMEAALLQRLELEAPAPGANPTRARIADRALADCLDLTGSLKVLRYRAGERLELQFEERYDIGSTGGRSLEIELSRTRSGMARISVDYFDRAAGFLVIPFAYVNPGWIRQARIERCLAGLSGSPRKADRIERPPLRPEDLVCERMQGRSCGPEGTLLPCRSAGGQPPLLCKCLGGWSCG